MMLDADTEAPSENFRGWKVDTATQDRIEISLDFVKPIDVSQGDFPDKLLVMVKLSEFWDNNGMRLDPVIVTMNDLPPQIGSSAEAEALQTVG